MGVLTFTSRTALIDGAPTNPGAPAEGLVMNARMVQATVDHTDQAPSWDAEANTQSFIDHLRHYRAHGLNAITVNLQGGLYRRSFGESYDAGGWNPDGSVRTAHRDRMISVIEAMLDLDMVPIVGLFYFRQDQILLNESAVRTAVDNAASFLAPYKSSIIVEVINEASHSFVTHSILQTDRVHELVDELVADGFYASFSLTPGAMPTVAQLGSAQVVLLHGNNQSPAGTKAPGIATMVANAKSRFPGKPILFNEDGPSDANTSYTASQYIANLNAAVANGAGWGYYDQSGFQEACDSANSGSWQCAAPDLDATGIWWGIDTAVKDAVFDRIAVQTGGAAVPEPPQVVYEEAGTGVVVMEVEAAPRPAGSHWTHHTFDRGYHRGGYYRWDGPERFGGPGTDSTLLFRFNVDTAGGRWWIGAHSRRNESGASDAHNDWWMKVNEDPWHKYWQLGGLHEVWEDFHRFEIGGVNVDPISGLAGVPGIRVGLNEIRITGRSAQIQPDRLVLVHDPGGAPTQALLEAHIDDPTSAISGDPAPPPPDPSPDPTAHERVIPGGSFVLLGRAPAGGVGEGQTHLRTITDVAGITDELTYAKVTEVYPASSFLHTPTDGLSLRQAILASSNKIVELANGNYGADGSCTNTTGLGGAYVFNRHGTRLSKTAVFDGGHSVEGFWSPGSGFTLRNFWVRRFLPIGGGVRFDGVREAAGEINWESGSNNLLWDMMITLSRMNAILFKCSNSEIRGGLFADIHRYGWAGGGSNNLVDGLRLERISYTGKTDPEVGAATDPGNRGACKTVFSKNWTVKNVEMQSVQTGIWFDIANEPAHILDITVDDCNQAPVFIEVSYGSGADGRRWLVDGVVATNSCRVRRTQDPKNFLMPAIVFVVLTPDVDIRNVRGDGQELCTVGFNTWNHSQLNNLTRSRMGVADSTVEQCTLVGRDWNTGWNDSVNYSQFPGLRRGNLDWSNNDYRIGGSYRWIDSILTHSQWLALGHT